MAEYEQILRKQMDFPFEVFIADNSAGDISSPAHWHDCFEIMYTLTGKATQIINGQTFYTQAGDIVFVKSGNVHRTVCDQSLHTKIVVIKFMHDIITDYHAFSNSKYIAAFLNDQAVKSCRLQPEIQKQAEQYMLQIFDEFNQKQEAYEIYIKANIYHLIGLFVRNKVISTPQSSNQEQLKKIAGVIEFLEKQYASEISLSDISKQLNLNYHYTSRLFKSITGKSFKEFLDFIRISEADKLIYNTDQSLAQISYQCGFSCQQAFSRSYKRIKGHSPKTHKVKKC